MIEAMKMQNSLTALKQAKVTKCHRMLTVGSGFGDCTQRIKSERTSQPFGERRTKVVGWETWILTQDTQ